MIFILTMEEFFTSEIGIDYADVLHKRDLSIPTVHLESDFRKRLYYFDQINIEVRAIDIGPTSITWVYKGYRIGIEEEVVVERHL